MYNQNYEEYMRSVLGYSPNYQGNTYRDTNYYNVQNPIYYNEKIEKMYPEIYKKIYPLIVREVGANTRSITEDVIDEIVTKIYNEVEESQERNISNATKGTNTPTNNSTKNIKTADTEDRQVRQGNTLLKDLIRILLLRELIVRPGFPNRPPMPGPERPQFPGGMGMPAMPRDYYM